MVESLSESSERSVISRLSSRLGESLRQLSISPTSGSSVSMSKTSRLQKSAVWDYFEYDDEQDKSLSRMKYDRANDRYKSVTWNLAIFISTSNVPNSLVENLEFCDLLNTADPRYTPPSKTVISKEIEKILIKMKANIGCYLEHAKKVSLTADVWSEKGLSSSYLGITGHFFSRKDHHRHCVTLAVHQMPPSHTAKNIRAIVDQVLLEWEIPSHKISVILTDNGSNIVAAFRGHFCTSSEDDGESGDEDIDQQGESSQIQDEGSIELDVSNFEEEEIHHEVAFHDFR